MKLSPGIYLVAFALLTMAAQAQTPTPPPKSTPAPAPVPRTFKPGPFTYKMPVKAIAATSRRLPSPSKRCKLKARDASVACTGRKTHHAR